MACADVEPADAAAWVALAHCLEERRLHEAAARAWRHAWESDPGNAGEALAAALDFAHRTGDDDLVVDIAASVDVVAGSDEAGHLGLARAVPGAPDEETALQSVSPFSCRWPYAQLRVAGLYLAEGDARSEWRALGSAMTGAGALRERWTLGRGPLWESWALADAALLQMASIQARADAELVAPLAAATIRDGDPSSPYGQSLLAWALLQTGEPVVAEQAAAEAARAVPEAAVVLVLARVDLDGDVEAAVAEARARWEPVRETLVEFREGYADRPEEAPDVLLDLPIPREALSALGSAGPQLTLWVRSYMLDREERRVRRDPVAAALVAEARRDVDAKLGAAVLALAEDGVRRIDAALALADAAARGDPVAEAPPQWTAARLGWPPGPLWSPPDVDSDPPSAIPLGWIAQRLSRSLIVRACFASSDLPERVELRFHVAPDGSVPEFGVVDTALRGSPLEACLGDAVRAIDFPETDGAGTTVTWPFVVER